MEAKELRIGNLINVIDRSGEVHMPNGTAYVIHEIGLGDVGLLMSGLNLWSNDLFKVSHFDMSPIPLTEEWLLKFGFTKSNEKLYFLPIPLLSMEIHLVFFRNEWLIELSNDRKNIVTEATKIHQLQNLYFALTGKELEVVNA